MEKNYQDLINLYKMKIEGQLTKEDLSAYILSIEKQIDACYVYETCSKELEELKEEAYWLFDICAAE